MISTDSPGYMIPPGSVWNDIKDRLLVCFTITGAQDPYTIELMIIRNSPEPGKRLLEFESVGWPAVKKMIETGKMQRCPSMEPEHLKQ